MKEFIQARNFYRSLTENKKNDLADSIAADIFFLDETLQKKVIELLFLVDAELKEKVMNINSFTL